VSELHADELRADELHADELHELHKIAHEGLLLFLLRPPPRDALTQQLSHQRHAPQRPPAFLHLDQMLRIKSADLAVELWTLRKARG
jgi:hypothetical protein